MSKIKILLVDNNMLSRIGCGHIYKSFPETEVIGDAANSNEALEKAQELKPDVILINTSLPELAELETIQEIKKALPDSKIIIVNPAKEEKSILKSMKAEADGYCIKNQYPEELIPVVKKVFAGDKYVEKEIAKVLLSSKEIQSMSEENLYLIKLMAADFHSQDISKNLQISFEEVNNKIINLIKELASME